MPIVVPGLSTGVSSSTACTSRTSITQNSTEESSSSPATIRRRSTSSPPLGNQVRDSTHTKKIKRHRSGAGRLVARFARMVGGLHRKKSSGRKSVSITGTHLQALLVNQIRTLPEKWYRGNTVFKLTYRRTEIAKYAREPRSQGLFAGNALVKQ